MMRLGRATVLALLFAANFGVACATSDAGERSPAPVSEAPASRPAESTAEAPNETPDEAGEILTGGIVEVYAQGGYTYLRVATENKGEVWAAVPVAEISKGDRVTLRISILMRGFVSPSSGRSFDAIYFAEVVDVTKAVPAGLSARR